MILSRVKDNIFIVSIFTFTLIIEERVIREERELKPRIRSSST